MRFFNKAWKIWGEKGKIASIIGFFLTVPANIRTTWLYFHGVTFTKEDLTVLVVMNMIGIIWFILPSSITISGTPFKLEIED
jgi:uncharacterized membrane protein